MLPLCTKLTTLRYFSYRARNIAHPCHKGMHGWQTLYRPSQGITDFWKQKFPVFPQLMRPKVAAFSFDSGRMINYTEGESEQQLCLPRDLVINTEGATCDSATALAVQSLVIFNWHFRSHSLAGWTQTPVPSVKESWSPATGLTCPGPSRRNICN